MSVNSNVPPLTVIGTTYSSRMIELVYRHLRKGLRRDKDCDKEVEDIMKKKVVRVTDDRQLELERLDSDGQNLPLFDRIKSSYKEWKVAEREHFATHVTSCLGHEKGCVILPGLQDALNDAITEAEGLLE